MTNEPYTAVKPGSLARLHPDVWPWFRDQIAMDRRLIAGGTVKYTQPGFAAFRRGVDGLPEWWSDSFLQVGVTR